MKPFHLTKGKKKFKKSFLGLCIICPISFNEIVAVIKLQKCRKNLGPILRSRFWCNYYNCNCWPNLHTVIIALSNDLSTLDQHVN